MFTCLLRTESWLCDPSSPCLLKHRGHPIFCSHFNEQMMISWKNPWVFPWISRYHGESLFVEHRSHSTSKISGKWMGFIPEIMRSGRDRCYVCTVVHIPELMGMVGALDSFGTTSRPGPRKKWFENQIRSSGRNNLCVSEYLYKHKVLVGWCLEYSNCFLICHAYGGFLN